MARFAGSDAVAAAARRYTESDIEQLRTDVASLVSKGFSERMAGEMVQRARRRNESLPRPSRRFHLMHED